MLIKEDCVSLLSVWIVFLLFFSLFSSLSSSSLLVSSLFCVYFFVVVVRRNLCSNGFVNRWKRRRREDQFHPTTKKKEEDEEEECSMLKKSEEKTIDVSRLSFEKSSLIGQGRCSEIYSGRYGEEKVAIKMFDQSRRNESNHLLFEREKWIYSLPLFDHLNLLQFFGSVTIDQSECLILQFARRGSLKEFLREHQINDEEQLIHFSAQIANGLEYLHQDCSTSIGKRRRGRFPIAHRDLKSENILLDENGDRLFLADFSMSIEINREDFSSSNHQQVGTPRYMSPEILAGTIGNEWNALLKCDIYALAIVFWEIISRLKTIGQSSLLIPHLSSLPSFRLECSLSNAFRRTIIGKKSKSKSECGRNVTDRSFSHTLESSVDEIIVENIIGQIKSFYSNN